MRILLLVLLGTTMLRAAAPLADSPFGPVVAGLAAENQGTGKEGSRAEILEDGFEALLVRVHLIRQAKISVEMQTFIWTNDECGRLLMYELVQAAQRGVRVRIIADHLFSDQDPATVAFLATVSPNLEIKHYRPAAARLKPSRLQLLLSGVMGFRAVNQRMHNKVMIVDGAVLITGGRNVENTYYNCSPGLNFRDRDVLVTGPVVREAAAAFADFWNYKHTVASRELADVGAAIAANRFPRHLAREDWALGELFDGLRRDADDAAVIARRFVAALEPLRRAEFVSDQPGKSRGYFSRTSRITRKLGDVVGTAQERITIQTPYLVLSRPAQDLLHTLREKHPALVVRVCTNSFASTDNVAAYSANYRLRNDYIEWLKLQVYEFKPHPATLPAILPQYDVLAERARRKDARAEPPFLSLHAKSLVVDDRLAFVGSYNLDPRSENLNTEAGLLVEDEAFARRLRSVIDRDMQPANSWVIAKRDIPLKLDLLNGLIDGLLSLTPIDLWPIQNTSSFELRAGAQEVAPDDAAFHRNYREVGSFPGADGQLSSKEIITRLYKAVGTPLTPIL